MTVAFTLSSGSTFDSAALTSATDWSFNESGSPTSFTSDGHRLVDLVTVDAIQATVSVNCTDTSLSLFKKVGSKGILALVSLMGIRYAPAIPTDFMASKSAVIPLVETAPCIQYQNTQGLAELLGCKKACSKLL